MNNGYKNSCTYSVGYDYDSWSTDFCRHVPVRKAAAPIPMANVDLNNCVVRRPGRIPGIRITSH